MAEYAVLIEYVDHDNEPRLEAVGPLGSLQEAIEMRDHLEDVDNGPEYVRNIVPLMQPGDMPAHWQC